MFGLNQNQMLAISIGILTGLTGMTAQLTTLLGPQATAMVAAGSAVIVMALSVVLTVTSGQGAQVRNVLAMPGVEKISVNSQASPTLATIAVDPAQDKIAPTQAAMQQVTATAKAAAA